MNISPRTYTIVAVTDCKLWVLKRQVFRKILEFIFTLNYEQNMKFLEELGFKHTISDENLMKTLDNILVKKSVKLHLAQSKGKFI